MAKLHHLASPGTINQMRLRNRMFMSPMGSNLAEEDGYCGERIRAYYEERAKGGAALVIMGSVAVGYPEGAANLRNVAVSHDRFIPGLKSVADAVHSHGGRIALQLQHAGVYALNDMVVAKGIACPSLPPLSSHDGDYGEVMLDEEAAAFAAQYGGLGELKFNPLDQAYMQRITDMFVDAALRAMRIGIDGVEIHGGHGYIFSSFLSPSSNCRDDEFGGSVENRARFLTNTVAAVRAAVGPDYPVWVRLDSVEFFKEDGISLADAITTAQLLEKAGVDAIHVSAHGDSSIGLTFTTGHATDHRAFFIPFAKAIKAAVSVPIICPGRIEPEDAEKAIRDGQVDFVTMGRKMLADPFLASKVMAGKQQNIRPCVYCYTCISRIFLSDHVACAVNPRTGFELHRENSSAPQTKRVAIIGGGPAGMYSARLLHDKGHQIVLFEASSQLGGTARFASIAYAPNQKIVDWLRREVEQRDITVKLNCRVDSATLAKENFDEVIVANGAARTLPDIPGADRDFVLSGDDMRALVLGEASSSLDRKFSSTTRITMRLASLTRLNRSANSLRSASKYWMPLGKSIVIIGGELVGLELAEFLAHRGREVTVLEEDNHVGRGIMLVRRFRAIDDCKRLGVKMLTQSREVAVENGSVSFTNRHGQRRRVQADHVIVARGATANLELANQLIALGHKVHTIGDTTGVGYIEGAMRDAALISEQI